MKLATLIIIWRAQYFFLFCLSHDKPSEMNKQIIIHTDTYHNMSIYNTSKTNKTKKPLVPFINKHSYVRTYTSWS